MNCEVLILYYSLHGSTRALADEIAHGVDSIAGASARLRTVPPVSTVCESSAASVPVDGPPYAETTDLKECAGLILGSPTRFGNMAAALKYFLDGTSAEWLAGTLAGKPAAVFTSSNSMHGGQESTLLSMALPLLHHGMFLVGVPFTVEEISTTASGGTPYGASHVARHRQPGSLSAEETRVARVLGERVAGLAVRLGRTA